MHSTMKLVGHQPEFLPWLGFFHKLTLCDTFMIVDNVQFKKKHFENRNRIYSNGKSLWITVPVQTQGRFNQHIDEVSIDNRSNWKRKILRSIELNYSKSPYFECYWPFFSQVIGRDHQKLIDLNVELIRGCMRFLNIEINVVKSSEKGVTAEGTELIIDMCRSVGSTTYVSGQSGRDYLDTDRVAKAGIDLLYQRFIHPEYRQMSEHFLTQMSVIDLLFNDGEKASYYIRKAGTWETS